jgi:hypothetical protein
MRSILEPLAGVLISGINSDSSNQLYFVYEGLHNFYIFSCRLEAGLRHFAGGRFNIRFLFGWATP